MKTENWKETKKILREALLVKPSERQKFLLSATPNGRLRAEVESLLALETEIDSFMSLPISDFSKDFLPDDEIEENHFTLAGQRIGIYEILGELGGGGMGTVYLGKRADGKFEQKVAIKMLRREFNNEKIRRHFRREREIQGKLNHPNIARLLDAGKTADGVPYLVMEFIEGAPIDKYCRAKNLSLKERLKLFNRICEAVATAHRNLIVHLDLKPSNILIDETGEPKLLDFGISKILDAENIEKNQTATMLGAMTPEYASPEQIRGETVTTATDVYSLGVVLFKILTGGYPYDFKNKTNGNLLKEITDSAPISLNEAAVNSDCAGKISAAALKGDLENIIQKSLSKEPGRRYKTIEQFSADIWRFIDGLPVAARPATVAYRARKFFQRNKVPVIAAAFVLLSLIGGIVVSLQQAQTARAAQNEAEQQSAFAKSEEEKSKKISRFMFKVFSYANPAWNAEGRKSGGQARVLDALEDLSGKIEIEFDGEKDIQAELHHQFGEVYGRVWAYNTEPARRAEMKEKSTFHICRALRLRREFYGDWHELVAKDLYYGAGCIAETEPERAAVWNKAIETFRGTNPNNLNLPHILVDYAHRLATPEQAAVHDIYLQAVNSPIGENKFEAAERYYREALPIFRRHYRPDSLPVFITECDLSYVLAMQDKWTDFDEHFAACRQGETEMKKHFSTVGDSKLPPLDLIEKTLAEKNR